MRFSFVFLLVLLASVFLFECTPSEEEFDLESTPSISFSVDTIFFDTLFVNRDSASARFRIFNNSSNAVRFDNVSLASPDSQFELIINGDRGNQFQDIEIFGGDSLLVIVTPRIQTNSETLPFVVLDSIIVSSRSFSDQVKIRAFGQNANFIPRGQLPCNSVWSNNLPYVLLDTVIVGEGCSLIINEGTRVFNDFNAGLFIQGKLEVRGSADSTVLFTNSRRTEEFDGPGQWRGIFILEGSEGNIVDHATIRNADFGLRVGSPDDNDLPDLTVSNTTVENMFLSGIIGFTSDIVVTNCNINNCRTGAIACLAGGNYQLIHNTIANLSFGFIADGPAVILSDNLILSDDNILAAPIRVELVNNIIWGNMSDEILLDNGGSQPFELSLNNNIIRTENEDLNINNNILNEDPLFVDPRNFNYELDTLSPAMDNGIDIGLDLDLLGNMRDEFPDIGAFERIE
ncbi:MAG: right-handed parallel beta-helix repeat-containing protein [Bacteroidota bacterium]